MITERIGTIALILYFFICILIIFVCFIFIFFEIQPELNTYYTSTITFIITKISIIIINKLIKLQGERLKNIEQQIKRISSSSSESNCSQNDLSSKSSNSLNSPR